MIIGTAGHIDHGKTSLVKAITGINADRLKEEQQRGITIDLGFAYWPQADGSNISFVDVPGHEGYIRNMLAGITGVSALMLVVAANEGIKPQTREHLLIAELVGLKNCVVALTKADLADDAMIASRVTELRSLLYSTSFSGAEIIPVSANRGDGIDELKQRLLTFQSAETNTTDAPFRMPVDRVFTIKGSGSVITGSVQAGSVALDDRMVLSPSGQVVRVRGLQVQNHTVLNATAGDRAAVNLASVSTEDIHRGDVLVASALHSPTQRMDVSVVFASGEKLPKSGVLNIHMHSGTGAWTGRLNILSQDKGRVLGRIVLDRPAAIWEQDHFVLRDASASRTIGGGVVLDIQPPLRQSRLPMRLLGLHALAGKGPAQALPELLLHASHCLCLEAFAAQNALDPAAFAAVITQHNLLHLRHDGQGWLFDPGVLLTLVRQLKQVLAEHHTRHSDQAGLSAQRLRLALEDRLSPAAFAAVAAHMIKRNEIAATGDLLRLPDHVPRLTPEHEALWKALQPMLSGDERFKPPRVNELSLMLRRREDTVRGVLKRLARRGDVDEVATDHFLLRSSVAELAEVAVSTAAASTDGWFNAAAFRDQIGIGRKMAILVLEYFDRQGFTIRKDDLRRIDQRNAALFASGK
ncbi:MAG: selenocysteine-specific translation elongation factor [Beijerinckiaceae bacterium]